MTSKQKILAKKHGTPNEFARAVMSALGEVSLPEATRAIEKYCREWTLAAAPSDFEDPQVRRVLDRLNLAADKGPGSAPVLSDFLAHQPTGPSAAHPGKTSAGEGRIRAESDRQEPEPCVGGLPLSQISASPQPNYADPIERVAQSHKELAHQIAKGACTEPACRKNPQVHDELAQLGASLDDVSTQFEKLAALLQPVLKPEDKTSSGCSELVSEARVPLAESIRQNRYRLEILVTALKSILSRLEI
jgi:hypothetical protein